MGKIRPFEPIEDELITDRRLAGLGTTVIARELYTRLGSRRSPATVNMRLKTLAARDEAAEDADTMRLANPLEPGFRRIG